MTVNEIKEKYACDALVPMKANEYDIIGGRRGFFTVYNNKGMNVYIGKTYEDAKKWIASKGGVLFKPDGIKYKNPLKLK